MKGDIFMIQYGIVFIVIMYMIFTLYIDNKVLKMQEIVVHYKHKKNNVLYLKDYKKHNNNLLSRHSSQKI